MDTAFSLYLPVICDARQLMTRCDNPMQKLSLLKEMQHAHADVRGQVHYSKTVIHEDKHSIEGEWAGQGRAVEQWVPHLGHRKGWHCELSCRPAEKSAVASCSDHTSAYQQGLAAP